MLAEQPLVVAGENVGFAAECVLEERRKTLVGICSHALLLLFSCAPLLLLADKGPHLRDLGLQEGTHFDFYQSSYVCMGPCIHGLYEGA